MAERVIATTRTPEKKQDCHNSCKQNPGSSFSGSPADRILQLQRTAGNQAVQRLIKSRELQAKLKISQPNDAYEQEADRVAEQVMKIPEGEGRQEKETIRTKSLISGIAPLAQRLLGNKEGEKGEEKEEIFRAKESGNDSVGLGFENRFMQLKGRGSPLPEPTRKSMESRLETDLSAVKVHSGPEAAGLAREISAKAFTSGKDIYFGENQFKPGTVGGDRLLAHEMTHVIQQSGDSSRPFSRMKMFSDSENSVIARKDGDSSAKTDTKAASTAAGDTAPGVVELKGVSEFKPPEQVSNYLNEKQAGNVQVCFGKLAEGIIKVEKSKGKGDSESYKIKDQAIPLKHPIFAGLDPGPNLILNTNKGPVQGYIGMGKGGSEAFIDQLKKYPERIGLPGFDLLGGGKLSNKLENGALEFGFEGVPINLGGAFSGTLTLKAVNENVTFNGNAHVNVKGLGSENLVLSRSEEGLVKGEVKVGVNLKKNVTGEVTVFWTGEVIEGKGNVGSQGEKLSGNVLFQVMERKEAEKLAEEKKAPTGEEAPSKSVAKTKNKHTKTDYAVFGEGDLTFAFTEWLNGTAHTIVDQNGYVTIIGKITPQKEFELFSKDYNKDLFKLEARASYGIPVVGDIFIFGNIGMGAFAKIGPAKFYNIEVDGTYSTDPKKKNDFSIRGSLNISAAAGLKLRGEAGAGLEILDHDIKAGAGINGIAGIKGYVEATPIIGYREKGTDGEDKKGEFFIRGELEIAAQPFLGLSGDLFVEIDTPWWSPMSDKKWTWPLVDKEWPIGGSLGIGASVDYVFGSGVPPAVEFKPVEFSADKFMTDLYSDKAQAKSGEKEPQKGGWAEKNSKVAEPPSKAAKKGNAQLGKAPEAPKAKSKVQPGGAKKSKKDPDPNARTKEGKSVKQLKDEAAKKGKKPEGKEPKGKGEEKGKAEDKEKAVKMAKDKVKAEVKTKLPKGAKQAADVNKVLDGIAPKVKPSLSNLHAEEVMPGKPKNEGAIGFKVKGKEEKGGDVLIDSVRYSQEGKALSHEERWKKGVEGVTKSINKLRSKGISEKAIRAQFPAWESEFGFKPKSLTLIITEKRWVLEGEMSPGKQITEGKENLQATEGGIQERFKVEFAKMDEYAAEYSLTKIKESKDETVKQAKNWKDVRKWLIDNGMIFKQPLSKSTNFGKNQVCPRAILAANQALSEKTRKEGILLEDIHPKADEKDIVKKSQSKVNSGENPFETSKVVLQEFAFDKRINPLLMLKNAYLESNELSIAIGLGPIQLHHLITEQMVALLEKYQPDIPGRKLRDDHRLQKNSSPGGHIGYEKWHRKYDEDMRIFILKFPQGKLSIDKLISAIHDYYQPGKNNDISKKIPGVNLKNLQGEKWV